MDDQIHGKDTDEKTFVQLEGLIQTYEHYWFLIASIHLEISNDENWITI